MMSMLRQEGGEDRLQDLYESASKDLSIKQNLLIVRAIERSPVPGLIRDETTISAVRESRMPKQVKRRNQLEYFLAGLKELFQRALAEAQGLA